MRVACLALAVAVVAATPGLAHFHNFAWEAEGLAVRPDGSVAAATVTWGGLCEAAFRVDLRDAGGSLVEGRVFAGYQDLHEVPMPPNANVEVIAVDAASTDPAVAFHLDGPQVAKLGAGDPAFVQGLTGSYQDWRLVLVSLDLAMSPC